MMSRNYPLFHPEYAQRLTKLYVEGFGRRLLPIFADIESEADQAEQEYINNATSRRDFDPESVGEAALGHGVGVLQDLHFIRGQLIGLAAAGLFHLWEKLCKEFLDTELRSITQMPTHDVIANFDFNSVCSELIRVGIHIRPKIKDDIDVLRRLANTVKHGDGTSCQCLAAMMPELFFNPLFLPATASMLDLKPEHFERFSTAVLQFWEHIPRTWATKEHAQD
jgi:hypothetical protein